MAFVAATTAKVNDGGSSSVVINVPSHTDGDLLLLFWNDRNSLWTLPLTGWTEFVNFPGVVSRTKAFYRTASSEPGSYTLTSSGGTSGHLAIMLAYSNTSVASSTLSPAPRFDNQLGAAADKDGAGSSTLGASANNVAGYLVVTMQNINGYLSFNGEPNSDYAVTPTAPTTFRAQTACWDTTPQGPVEFLWVGDEVATSVEPGWTQNWTFQANPPNSIGTKYLVSQASIGLVTPPQGDSWQVIE